MIKKLSATLLSFLLFFSIGLINLYSQVDTPKSIPGQYIVVLYDDIENPGEIAELMTGKYNLIPDLNYKFALKGFSAYIPTKRLDAVRSDPLVKFVEQDLIVQAVKGKPPGKGGGGDNDDNPPTQEIPTGVDRCDLRH